MTICKKIISCVLVFVLAFGMVSVAGAVFSVCASDVGAAEEADGITVKAINCGTEVILSYKETKTYEFEAENLPEGAVVHVFCSGEDRGAGTRIDVESPTGDYTVQAKVFDKDGAVIAESAVIKVTVKNGVTDRLRVFFKNDVARMFDGVLDIVGAIFMRIWIFLHR